MHRCGAAERDLVRRVPPSRRDAQGPVPLRGSTTWSSACRRSAARGVPSRSHAGSFAVLMDHLDRHDVALFLRLGMTNRLDLAGGIPNGSAANRDCQHLGGR